MVYSESAGKLRELIEKAIEDHLVTRAEYDSIMAMAFDDGHIDRQEQALLSQLQEMIENKTVKIIP
ncbi:MAG: hypothetical protein JXB34_05135 [Bacteroidales bacterium]|nr:hypothetical protein [Bacteroidales bacterium]